MENIVLVTTGTDSARLPEPFQRRLCFSHCLSPAASLRRRIATLEPDSSILGVSDVVPLESGGDPERLCSDLLAEVEALGCPGVFLDLERGYPVLREFVKLADERLHAEGVPLYVPERCGEGLRHAVVVCEGAVSGGSFDRRFADLLEGYGEGRVAAVLQPVCTGFELPSQDADGAALTLGELEALRARHGAQVYFSKELCAKYFTFMDEHSQGHFVLFDDRSTVQEKYRRLTAMGVGPCFVLARDASLLL
ncbi:MAG: hypothetical protein HFH27_09590 [Clostridiaceae bacterium]|nr:hypothetical protein [Clostridiaceae bacterium]MCI9484695.1 hypothetical protein [Clostridiaceae bacterium]NBH80116.1 hypothetical protein [Clostridiaceae bacterium]NBI83215.1 hypothetical protein [Clostridiaceae bacterium]